MVINRAASVRPYGWCGLGDLARTDGDGYLRLGGRLDGMINTGSYHVYPREVEAAITRIAGVREVVVRGESDRVWGGAIAAYLVPHDDAESDLIERIRRSLELRLARYKIPRRFVLLQRLAGSRHNRGNEPVIRGV